MFFFCFVYFFQLCFKWVSVPSELPDQPIHNTIVGSILTKPEKRRVSNAALAHTVSVSKGVGAGGCFHILCKQQKCSIPLHVSQCVCLSPCAGGSGPSSQGQVGGMRPLSSVEWM